MSGRIPPLSLHAWLRWDAVSRLLPDGARTVLEIGAGQGAMGVLLARRYDYLGLEPDSESRGVAAERLGSGLVLEHDAESFEPGAPVDVLCAFEVLEHLADDRAAVAGWLRLLRPGGWLLVSVPLGSGRMAAADHRAGHYRRYDRRDLAGVLESAGLVDVELISYGFPLGYALEAVRNLLSARTAVSPSIEARTAASGRWLQPPDAAARATQLLALPFRLAQRPFSRGSLGTGLVARARKPDASEYSSSAPADASAL